MAGRDPRNGGRGKRTPVRNWVVGQTREGGGEIKGSQGGTAVQASKLSLQGRESERKNFPSHPSLLCRGRDQKEEPGQSLAGCEAEEVA